MRLTDSGAALLCACLFLEPTLAHRQCTSCIPLSDLLSEGYGIEILANGLSSAVAFHNGSVAPIGSVAASQEYQDLMWPILAQSFGQEPRKAATRCPDSRLPHQPSLFDESLPDFVLACFRWVKQSWQQVAEQQPQDIDPLHPTAQLIQSQMLALPPFAEMVPEALSQVAVGVQIPSWLAGSEEACHVAAAAQRTFGRVVRLESPPSSAYTAAGYELCRISYDAFDCTGPGRIMTLEYDDGLAVASVMETPLSSWAANPVYFSAREALTPQVMVDWINAFVDSQKPDKLMLAGANADDLSFVEAVKRSRAASYLEDHSSLPASQVLALGVAQAAKDALESQPDDCGESAECENLRRRADAIAGVYRPPEPPTWPAVGLRHLEL